MIANLLTIINWQERSLEFTEQHRLCHSYHCQALGRSLEVVVMVDVVVCTQDRDTLTSSHNLHSACTAHRLHMHRGRVPCSAWNAIVVLKNAVPIPNYRAFWKPVIVYGKR